MLTPSQIAISMTNTITDVIIAMMGITSVLGVDAASLRLVVQDVLQDTTAHIPIRIAMPVSITYLPYLINRLSTYSV
jgi:hypothetical protein